MNKHLKWIRDFYKQFNVKATIVNKLYCGANANVFSRRVYFSKKSLDGRSRNDIYRIHLVMHELSHILCYDHKKFYNYYYYNINNKKERKKIRKIGLKAERYCDKMAYKFVRSLFPDLPLAKSYNSIASKQWYTKNFLNRYFK